MFLSTIHYKYFKQYIEEVFVGGERGLERYFGGWTPLFGMENSVEREGGVLVAPPPSSPSLLLSIKHCIFVLTSLCALCVSISDGSYLSVFS